MEREKIVYFKILNWILGFIDFGFYQKKIDNNSIELIMSKIEQDLNENIENAHKEIIKELLFFNYESLTDYLFIICIAKYIENTKRKLSGNIKELTKIRTLIYERIEKIEHDIYLEKLHLTKNIFKTPTNEELSQTYVSEDCFDDAYYEREKEQRDRFNNSFDWDNDLDQQNDNW